MLSSMRKGVSTIFAKIILGFLILTFAVWGVGDVVRTHGQSTDVATIGSRSISALTFERELRNQEEVFKQRLGAQYNPQILTTMRIPQQVLGRKINEELFALEAEHLGLIPSDDTVAGEIRKNPDFRGLIGFESAKFQTFLNRAGLSETVYVNALKRDIGIRLLFDTYHIKPTAPQFAVQLADAIAKETRSVTVYNVPKNALKPLAEPTTQQLTETYQINAKDFVQPETREASLAILERPSEEAMTKAANQLEDLLAGGASFAEAAKEAGANVSKLPAVTRAGLLPDGGQAPLPTLEHLLATIFDTEQGGESNVASGGGGKMYLVHVDKVTPENVPPLAQVRPTIEKLWRKEQADKAYGQLADDIAVQFQKPEARANAIADYKLSATTRTVTRSDQDLPADMVTELFTLAKDVASGAYKTNRGDYALAVVESIPSAGVPAYNPASPNLARLNADMEQEQLELLGSYLRTKYKVTVHEDVIARVLEPRQ